MTIRARKAGLAVLSARRGFTRLTGQSLQTAMAQQTAATAIQGFRERQRSTTRRELVLAGRQLFSKEGIYESRIEDITRHAGIAKGTLYLHFRSKEDLVFAVVSAGFAELRAYVADRVAAGRSLKDAASAIFQAHVGFFEENQDMMRIFHQARGVLKFERPRWRPLRTQLRLHIEFLAQLLAQGEARSWTAARRRELAVFLFGCASGGASVLVSTYPESARLRAWSERWSGAIGMVVESSGGPHARNRRRGSSR